RASVRGTMSNDSNSPGTHPVEIRHVNELMNLIRQEISGLRDEIRSGLGQQVTHAEAGGFMSTVIETLNNIGQRVDRLEKTYEYRIKEIEGDLSEERKFKRQIIIALLGSVVTALVSILIAVFS